jgi:hypothetical protein
MFVPYCQRPSFTPIQNHRIIIFLFILILKFFECRREDRRFYTELLFYISAFLSPPFLLKFLSTSLSL